MPFPFKSTRGRSGPCFDGAPGRRDRLTMVSVLEEERTRPSSCFPGEVDEKRHCWSGPLGLRSTRGLQIYCHFDLTSVAWTRCYLPTLRGPESHLAHVGFHGWTQTFPPHSPSLLWPFPTGLQEAASVSETLLLSPEDNAHIKIGAKCEFSRESQEQVLNCMDRLKLPSSEALPVGFRPKHLSSAVADGGYPGPGPADSRIYLGSSKWQRNFWKGIRKLSESPGGPESESLKLRSQKPWPIPLRGLF